MNGSLVNILRYYNHIDALQQVKAIAQVLPAPLPEVDVNTKTKVSLHLQIGKDAQ